MGKFQERENWKIEKINKFIKFCKIAQVLLFLVQGGETNDRIENLSEVCFSEICGINKL